jgi:hypothetical protein
MRLFVTYSDPHLIASTNSTFVCLASAQECRRHIGSSVLIVIITMNVLLIRLAD